MGAVIETGDQFVNKNTKIYSSWLVTAKFWCNNLRIKENTSCTLSAKLHKDFKK